MNLKSEKLLIYEKKEYKLLIYIPHTRVRARAHTHTHLCL
jgi:hypothetical protein